MNEMNFETFVSKFSFWNLILKILKICIPKVTFIGCKIVILKS